MSINKVVVCKHSLPRRWWWICSKRELRARGITRICTALAVNTTTGWTRRWAHSRNRTECSGLCDASVIAFVLWISGPPCLANILIAHAPHPATTPYVPWPSGTRSCVPIATGLPRRCKSTNLNSVARLNGGVASRDWSTTWSSADEFGVGDIVGIFEGSGVTCDSGGGSLFKCSTMSTVFVGTQCNRL